MTATSPTARALALVAASTFCIAACTSPGPDTLARAEESPALTLSPVTTSPLGTIEAPPTTIRPTTSVVPEDGEANNDEDEAETSEEEVALAGVARIEEQLLPLLGPTESLSTAVNAVATFPRSIPTPADAVITEISIGTGAPAEDGTVIAQIGVSVSTSAASSSAFDRVANAVQAAGMFPIDSVGEGDTRSASFRIPGGDQFDELVISAAPNGDRSTVRIVSNQALPSLDLVAFMDWADADLPLPAGDLQRTLIVAASSGEGRLAAHTLTVESLVILDGASAQREANRLLTRTENSEVFGTDADLAADQPLNGLLTFRGLDTLQYVVIPAVRTIVDSEGELEDVEGIEIRLIGSKTL